MHAKKGKLIHIRLIFYVSTNAHVSVVYRVVGILRIYEDI